MLHRLRCAATPLLQGIPTLKSKPIFRINWSGARLKKGSDGGGGLSNGLRDANDASHATHCSGKSRAGEGRGAMPHLHFLPHVVHDSLQRNDVSGRCGHTLTLGTWGGGMCVAEVFHGACLPRRLLRRIRGDTHLHVVRLRLRAPVEVQPADHTCRRVRRRRICRPGASDCESECEVCVKAPMDASKLARSTMSTTPTTGGCGWMNGCLRLK